LFPLPTTYKVESQKKLQVVVFNIAWEVGGEVRLVKLYSRLASAQKRQNCKFVPRLLSLIVDNISIDQREVSENGSAGFHFFSRPSES